MFLYKTSSSLQRHLEAIKAKPETIGFVPTMGALHEGHHSLVSHSLDQGCYTVVSIYVNPTQFNDSKDLEKYPRPTSSDLRKLQELGVDVVFLPDDKDIYPDGREVKPHIPLGSAGEILEADFRPGHFEGVVQVMDRLLRIVQPHKLFMGSKDLQQLAVVDKLIDSSGFDCELIGLPIIREPNGLARSSRNERLEADDRKNASIIYRTLMEICREYRNFPIARLKEMAVERLNQPPFRAEYFDFVRTDSFQILETKPTESMPVSAVTAVWCGDVRLIDNMEMPENGGKNGRGA